jgi:multiple sugar transport system permease protein
VNRVRPRRISDLLVSPRVFSAVLLFPALLVLVVVTAGPFIYLFATSFTPLDLTRPGTLRFHGLQNYERLLDDARFLNSLRVQAQLSVTTVTGQVVIGLGLALLLHRRMPLSDLVRSAYIIPMVLPPIIVAIIWKIIFTPLLSPLNVLNELGIHLPSLLTHPRFALWTIIVANTWQWIPFTMLIFLASLQMLPDDPVEAAIIDGASAPQLFRFVVLPFLRPAIIVAALFRLIDSFKAFPLIFVMTGGGPGTATEPTNYYAYLEGFAFTHIGYSSSILVVLLLIILALAMGMLKIRRAHDVE